MGKRELLLIVAFAIAGAVVYQATAPPAAPNERSFSFSGILDKVRREMRGNRASVEETREATLAVGRTVTEIRVANNYAELTITGEDRPDVESTFHVRSSAFDDAEAKALMAQTQLQVDHAGPVLRLESKYPEPGSQTTRLTLKVPRRMVVNFEGGARRVTVTGVAGFTAKDGRGEMVIRKVPGLATVTHRGGNVVVEDVGAIKLTARHCETRVARVAGEASFTLEGGELEADALRGAIDVDARHADVALRKLQDAKGAMRVNAVSGSLRVEGLATEAKLDGRHTEIDIEMARAAPVAVYLEGDEIITLTAPPGGFTLDAVVTQGHLTVPDEYESISVQQAKNGEEQQAQGAVGGGGPTITLRAKHGRITVRSAEPANATR